MYYPIHGFVILRRIQTNYNCSILYDCLRYLSVHGDVDNIRRDPVVFLDTRATRIPGHFLFVVSLNGLQKLAM